MKLSKLLSVNDCGWQYRGGRPARQLPQRPFFPAISAGILLSVPQALQVIM